MPCFFNPLLSRFAAPRLLMPPSVQHNRVDTASVKTCDRIGENRDAHFRRDAGRLLLTFLPFPLPSCLYVTHTTSVFIAKRCALRRNLRSRPILGSTFSRANNNWTHTLRAVSCSLFYHNHHHPPQKHGTQRKPEPIRAQEGRRRRQLGRRERAARDHLGRDLRDRVLLR